MKKILFFVLIIFSCFYFSYTYSQERPHLHDNSAYDINGVGNEDSLPGEHINKPLSTQPPGLFSNNQQYVYFTEINQCNLSYHELRLENEKLRQLNGLLEKKVAILEESREE